MEKEQAMGLVTQTLTRPTTQTLQLTLGRLHPSLMRKYFRSYPKKNPFCQIKQQQNAAQKQLQPAAITLNAKRLFQAKDAAISMSEMKDNDDMLFDEEDEHTNNNTNNRNRNSSKMEEDANETDVEMVEEDEDEDDDDEIKLDEDEEDEIEEYRPCKFLGISPCSDIPCGFIYGGHSNKWQDSTVHKLGFRVFTLEESLKVGSVIDARDFTGKWYQAEVIAVADGDGNEFDTLDHDNDDYLEIRRAKIHYLGYSQNYDEWLNVDTDSHRIAQRGTFTVGPDLRAIRRNTTSFRSSADNNGHSHAHAHSHALNAVAAVANLDAAVAASQVAQTIAIHRASSSSRMNRNASNNGAPPH